MLAAAMNFIVIANITITLNRFYLAGGDTRRDSATNASCISSKICITTSYCKVVMAK